ncbi:MAG TPA: von Willebrand factor type A domain-containing protein, partial [Thermoanaerobaculia bacterium]|nr:von Willebrand factor type A domain-containing protein [Thermoanaerobaculia bacterium]
MGAAPLQERASVADTGVEMNTEEYGRITDNPFLETLGNPLSTFSIDVDRASYSNVRRFLTSNQGPPHDAVRIEEMINYFSYDYPDPPAEQPFSITTEIASCP